MRYRRFPRRNIADPHQTPDHYRPCTIIFRKGCNFLLYVILAFLIIPGAVIFAHPLSVSYSQFILGDREIEAVYRLPMDDIDLLLQLDEDLDGTVTAAELETAHAGIESYLDSKVSIATDGTPLEPRLQSTSIWRDNSDFPYLEARTIYAAGEPVDQVVVEVRLLTDLYPNHVNLAEFKTWDNREEFIFQQGNAWSGGREAAGGWRTAWQFMLLGIEHIVTGYDHLLFLLGLLLVGRGVRNLVAIVTSFTIAHSLTLALATLGVIQVADWIVEAAIALSIAYVGAENLLTRENRRRWRLTFFFGMVHGLGFATILQDMDLERSDLLAGLFTFNLGVEIGQLAIVALCWPLLQQLSKSPYRLVIVRLLSAIILAAGLLWFLERIQS